MATLDPTQLDETASVAEVEKRVSDDTLNYLDSIGNKRTRYKWEIGDICVLLIDRDKLPAMQVYEIVGKRVDYGIERVRQLVSISRYYTQEARECYDALPYSIFEYARKCPQPLQVLQEAYEKRQSLAVVKFTNKPVMEEFSRVYKNIPAHRRAEANEIVEVALKKLMELAE